MYNTRRSVRAAVVAYSIGIIATMALAIFVNVAVRA